MGLRQQACACVRAIHRWRPDGRACSSCSCWHRALSTDPAFPRAPSAATHATASSTAICSSPAVPAPPSAVADGRCIARWSERRVSALKSSSVRACSSAPASAVAVGLRRACHRPSRCGAASGATEPGHFSVGAASAQVQPGFLGAVPAAARGPLRAAHPASAGVCAHTWVRAGLRAYEAVCRRWRGEVGGGGGVCAAAVRGQRYVMHDGCARSALYASSQPQPNPTQPNPTQPNPTPTQPNPCRVALSTAA